jgi:hypothetical protein
MCIFVAFIKSLFLRFNFDGSFDQNYYMELLIVVDSILTCNFIFLEIMEVKKQLELLQLENQGSDRNLG